MKNKSTVEEQKPQRTFAEVNADYKHVATLIGDIVAKVSMLEEQKARLLKRVYELDAEASEAMQRETAQRAQAPEEK